MSKPIVIYHKADNDGIFCREIAKKFLPDATLIGWDYGDPTPAKAEIDGTEDLYMLDISVADLMDHPRLIWIDHHKSAMDKWPTTGRSIAGYRIDGVAACRLAWQWFTIVDGNTTFGDVGNPIRAAGVLPMIQDFKNRDVNEPIAVRLAGEYDIWDKRDPNAELFQHGLRSKELTIHDWAEMLSIKKATISEIEALIDVGHQNILNPDGTSTPPIVWTLLENGKVLQYASTKENASIIKSAGFTIEFEGLTFLACNHARYNSFLFLAGLEPKHDACFGFAWKQGQWTVSLYHAPGKEHHDLSLIAVKYGGGGHRGACGFRTAKLPFLP